MPAKKKVTPPARKRDSTRTASSASPTLAKLELDLDPALGTDEDSFLGGDEDPFGQEPSSNGISRATVADSLRVLQVRLEYRVAIEGGNTVSALLNRNLAESCVHDAEISLVVADPSAFANAGFGSLTLGSLQVYNENGMCPAAPELAYYARQAASRFQIASGGVAQVVKASVTELTLQGLKFII